MPSRWLRPILFLSVLLCTCVPSAFAQTASIQLKVSADEPLKSSLQKHLERELAMLPDVVLAADPSDFIISVIALPVVTRSQNRTGFAVSVLVTAPQEPKIREFAESHLSPERRAQLMSMTAGAVKQLAHWIETAAAGELQEVSQSIIKSFAKDVLVVRPKATVSRHLR